MDFMIARFLRQFLFHYSIAMLIFFMQAKAVWSAQTAAVNPASTTVAVAQPHGVSPVAAPATPQPHAAPAVPSVVSAMADYHLVTANNELEACSSVPLSGGASLLGRDLTYGLNLIFNKAKQSGGINGVTVKLSTMDDHYVIAEAESNVETMIKKSPLFLGNFGTEQLLAALPLIAQKKMVMLFPFTGSSLLRKPEYSYMVHYRASIAREVIGLINYAVKKMYKRKIAIFYEDNRWGEDGLSAAEKELKKLGIPLVAKSSYPQNTVGVLAAAQEIAKGKPSAIICIGHSRPTYSFIQNVVNLGMQNCAFLGVSELTPMQKLIKRSRGINLITSSLVPDPFHSELPIVKQYRDDMKTLLSNVAISPFSLEGYISASIFAEAIKKTVAPITVDKFIKTLEGFSHIDIGGLQLNFDPLQRSLCNHVWINTGEEHEWEISPT